MTFQFLIIILQCAAVAAFLILWYFWVKRKMECSFLLEEEQSVLFPFRYFSWVLIGVVFVTCLVQIHFIRSAAVVHEKVSSVTTLYQQLEQHARSINDIKEAIEKLHKENEINFKNLQTQNIELMQFRAEALGGKENTSRNNKEILVAVKTPNGAASAFAKEAKASSAEVTSASKEENRSDKIYTMRLDQNGRAKVDNLRVRKQPNPDSDVVEKLASGQLVKVTEKRLINENVWFRVITPSGRAGWVDYRFLKLEGST